jgi:site-specific DNA-methyltransferase (adenine-specific)
MAGVSSSGLLLVRSIHRVRVFQASADRILAALPDGSVDLLLTDPPYTTVDRHSKSGHLRDWFTGGMSWPQIGHVLALGRRKLKSSGVAMVMTNGAGLGEAIAAMKRAGFAEVRPITWDRRSPGLGSGLRHQTEFVLVGRQAGSRSLVGTDLVSAAAVGPATAGRYPTEKPVELGRVLARMAGIGRGALVVDPFCGSGALLVGSLERGATVAAGDVARRAVSRATHLLAGPIRPKATKSGSTPPGPTRKRPTSGRATRSTRSSTAHLPAKPNRSTGSTRSSTAHLPARSRPGRRP